MSSGCRGRGSTGVGGRVARGAHAATALVLAAALALGGGGGVAFAQAGKKKAAGEKKAAATKTEGGDEGGEKKEGEGDTPKVQVERGAGGKKVYVIKTGFVIEGRIQKPNAFYVLQRSSMDYDWELLKQDFLPKILDATRHHPF